MPAHAAEVQADRKLVRAPPPRRSASSAAARAAPPCAAAAAPARSACPSRACSISATATAGSSCVTVIEPRNRACRSRNTCDLPIVHRRAERRAVIEIALACAAAPERNENPVLDAVGVEMLLAHELEVRARRGRRSAATHRRAPRRASCADARALPTTPGARDCRRSSACSCQRFAMNGNSSCTISSPGWMSQSTRLSFCSASFRVSDFGLTMTFIAGSPSARRALAAENRSRVGFREGFSW